MGEQPLTIHCPRCDSLVSWTKENNYRPFCSKRCQLIDLGKWATEQCVIHDDKTTTFTD